MVFLGLEFELTTEGRGQGQGSDMGLGPSRRVWVGIGDRARGGPNYSIWIVTGERQSFKALIQNSARNESFRVLLSSTDQEILAENKMIAWRVIVEILTQSAHEGPRKNSALQPQRIDFFSWTKHNHRENLKVYGSKTS